MRLPASAPRPRGPLFQARVFLLPWPAQCRGPSGGRAPGAPQRGVGLGRASGAPSRWRRWGSGLAVAVAERALPQAPRLPGGGGRRSALPGRADGVGEPATRPGSPPPAALRGGGDRAWLAAAPGPFRAASTWRGLPGTRRLPPFPGPQLPSPRRGPTRFGRSPAVVTSAGYCHFAFLMSGSEFFPRCERDSAYSAQSATLGGPLYRLA